MSDQTPIKYLLIGNSDTSSAIGEISVATTSATKKVSDQIFSKICKTAEKKYDERNKITSKNENYFFTISKPNLVFLILVAASYPERYVFQLVEEIKTANIPSMTKSGSNELNSEGKTALKGLVDKYQDLKSISKIAEIQNDVDSIKVDMKQNIAQALETMDNVKELDDKAKGLKQNTSDYAKNANDLKKTTRCQHLKLILIIAAIVAAIVAVVVIIIVTRN